MQSIQKWNRVLAILIFLSSSVGWAALSQSEAQGYLGGQFGLSVPDEQNTTSRTAFGITGGAKLSEEFGVGGYFLNSTKSEGSGSSAFTFAYQMYGVDVNYFFDGSGAGAYFGGDLGLSKVTYTDAAGNAYNYSPFVWGVQGGYDYFLMPHFSLGAEIRVLFVSGADATTNNISHHLDAFTDINFLAAAKFWF